MRAAPLLPARPLLAALGAAALLALAGCGGEKAEDRFAPPCPKPSIPTDFNDLHRFRGAGRDITDSVLEGRILGVDGSCTRGDPGVTSTTITVSLELTRGPAATGRVADVAYFVAVSDGDRILDKQVFRLAPEFPANTDRLRLRGDEIELLLPVTGTKTAAAYRVSVGFQLTEAEVAENRRRLVPRR